MLHQEAKCCWNIKLRTNAWSFLVFSLIFNPNLRCGLEMSNHSHCPHLCHRLNHKRRCFPPHKSKFVRFSATRALRLSQVGNERNCAVFQRFSLELAYLALEYEMLHLIPTRAGWKILGWCWRKSWDGRDAENGETTPEVQKLKFLSHLL